LDDFDFLKTPKVNLKLLGVAFVVLWLAIYMGFLIYGDRGLNHYFDLQTQHKIIKQEVQKLREENMKLQKEYFGLKDIEDSDR
jgi:cell division protein FtsB